MDAEETEEVETKECPKCAETVKAKAAVCRFCGHDFAAKPVAFKDGDAKCHACHFVGRAKTYTPGSFFLEVILWFCFFVPGIIYSIWRLTSRYTGCANCQSRTIEYLWSK